MRPEGLGKLKKIRSPRRASNPQRSCLQRSASCGRQLRSGVRPYTALTSPGVQGPHQPASLSMPKFLMAGLLIHVYKPPVPAPGETKMKLSDRYCPVSHCHLLLTTVSLPAAVDQWINYGFSSENFASNLCQDAGRLVRGIFFVFLSYF
jgi:hypothetical protein